MTNLEDLPVLLADCTIGLYKDKETGKRMYPAHRKILILLIKHRLTTGE